MDEKIVEKPAKGAYEVEIPSILDQLMGAFVRANHLGRVMPAMLFRIGPQRRLARRPDVAFVATGRWRPIERRVLRGAAWEVVPDQAIEIIHPSNKAVDDARKLKDDFRAGVRAVWIVYLCENKIYSYLQ